MTCHHYCSLWTIGKLNWQSAKLKAAAFYSLFVIYHKYKYLPHNAFFKVWRLRKNIVSGNYASHIKFTAIIIAFIAIIIHFSLPSIINLMIRSQTKLEPGNKFFDDWSELKVPIGLSVNIFEITNVQSVLIGDRPHLRERGPYYFRQIRSREVIASEIEGTPLRYRYRVQYFFEPSKSNGTLSDEVTVVNLPILALAEIVDNFTMNLPLSVKIMANIILESVFNGIFHLYHEKLFVTVTVEELLFKGYNVEIINTLNNLVSPLKVFGLEFPTGGLIDGRFALFLDKNQSTSSLFTISRNSQKLGEILAVDEQSRLYKWPGYNCNELKGTDGSIFSPFISKSKRLYIYIAELCRSIYLMYSKSTEVKGIPTYRFEGTPSLFASPYYLPENYCYCPKSKNACKKNGLAYLGPCVHNAPIYLSFPHFLYSSARLVYGVKGMKPSIKKHISFMDIEPHISVPLNVRIRLQVNADVRSFSGIQSMSKIIQETIYPLAWFEQSASITDEIADEIKLKLLIPIKLSRWLIIGLIIISFLLLLFAFIHFLIKQKITRSPENNQPINSSDTSGFFSRLLLKVRNQLKPSEPSSINEQNLSIIYLNTNDNQLIHTVIPSYVRNDFPHTLDYQLNINNQHIQHQQLQGIDNPIPVNDDLPGNKESRDNPKKTIEDKL